MAKIHELTDELDALTEELDALETRRDQTHEDDADWSPPNKRLSQKCRFALLG